MLSGCHNHYAYEPQFQQQQDPEGDELVSLYAARSLEVARYSYQDPEEVRPGHLPEEGHDEPRRST